MRGTPGNVEFWDLEIFTVSWENSLHPGSFPGFRVVFQVPREVWVTWVAQEVGQSLIWEALPPNGGNRRTFSKRLGNLGTSTPYPGTDPNFSKCIFVPGIREFQGTEVLATGNSVMQLTKCSSFII